jgi:L-rhamnose-H+ transport protein
MMTSPILAGIVFALLSGLLNGTFTLPMRFLGRWNWENVWSLFVVISCVIFPALIVAGTTPHAWIILMHSPVHALLVATMAGFAWGFGAIMFGQSVSAIGISLANTFVLAISSSLGSVLPLLCLAPEKMFQRQGIVMLAGVAIAMAGIVLCGIAGRVREKAAESNAQIDRGDLVGLPRPLGFAVLLAVGSGVLSAVFNIGFTLAQPIADHARAEGLSQFASTNLIWWVMLGAGSIANLGFCIYLLWKNQSFTKFNQKNCLPLYLLTILMGVLYGGSIFVYGLAAPRLGTLGAAIGWPLSLVSGLLVANFVGLKLGEWRHAPSRSRGWLYSGIGALLIAVVVLSRANS